MNDLRRYALVTGASRGLGEALVGALLRDGYEVLAVARTPREDLVQEATSHNGTLHWIVADLSTPEGLQSFLDHVDDRVDPATALEVLLVSNAATLAPVGITGGSSNERIQDHTESHLAVTLNLAVPVALTRHMVMRYGPVAEQPPGAVRTVIHVSSGAARRVMPGLAVYSATKAGLNMYVQAAAEECTLLHTHGRMVPIRMLAVSPGLVDTAMQEVLRGADAALLPDRDTYIQWQREGSLKSPQDAAATLLSLLHREDIPSGAFVHIDEL